MFVRFLMVDMYVWRIFIWNECVNIFCVWMYVCMCMMKMHETNSQLHLCMYVCRHRLLKSAMSGYAAYAPPSLRSPPRRYPYLVAGLGPGPGPRPVWASGSPSPSSLPLLPMEWMLTWWSRRRSFRRDWKMDSPPRCSWEMDFGLKRPSPPVSACVCRVVIVCMHLCMYVRTYVCMYS
jgi:hypothetical protein